MAVSERITQRSTPPTVETETPSGGDPPHRAKSNSAGNSSAATGWTTNRTNKLQASKQKQKQKRQIVTVIFSRKVSSTETRSNRLTLSRRRLLKNGTGTTTNNVWLSRRSPGVPFQFRFVLRQQRLKGRDQWMVRAAFRQPPQFVLPRLASSRNER